MLGQRIGAYQIVSLLGEGGMGHVYAADEVTSSGVKIRRVAIKVLRPEHVADRQMSGRFLNEARTIGIVDHPGVVKIFDIGELPNGAPYIAMELLEGESLRARCQRIGLTHSQSLEIGLQLARTLAAVHAKSIVHRDLKPENVMLIQTDEGERVKVLDFGIAKWAQKNSGQSGNIKTRTGVMIGTPTYMAPEQCGGEGEVCDRTDVYALGVMIFEMLAGRPPFVGDQDAQIIGRQLFAPPPPLQQLAPQVDAGLAALVACMLAKDTRQRPSMLAVAGELIALRNGESGELTASKIGIVAANTVHLVQPRHTTLGQGAGQLASRRGLWAWSAAAALAAIVGAGVLWQMYLQRERMESAAAPSSIHWTITSEPAGAEVLGSDGISLGHTPLVRELPPGPGITAVVLRQNGYTDQRFELRHDQEVKVHAVLIEKPAAPRPTEAKAVAGKTSREGREKKEGREGKRRSRSKSGASSLHNSEVKLFAD